MKVFEVTYQYEMFVDGKRKYFVKTFNVISNSFETAFNKSYAAVRTRLETIQPSKLNYISCEEVE